ncbi:MAG TPA: DUF5655 domain-containing protein [Egicoccus sp.]|nr:DUF5655 domain-containing protein [Egicoccus sp.]HSK22975.1 DUF5655 domain-containing protein [Egicoccus sp.]
MTPEEFFADSLLGRAVFERLGEVLRDVDDVDVAATKSQVAFRRRRGFAYLWLPGMYLRNPQAEVVLSVSLPRAVDSPRWKEVAHPSAKIWQHHLEIRSVADVDDEVVAWLAEAAEAAG